MKKNYQYWFIAFLCLFVSKNIIAQGKLEDSKYGAIISEYLKANKTTSKTASADIDDIYVTKELFSEKTGIANAYLNQRYRGVKIYKATSSVGIKNGRVFHFADKFESNISARINTTAASITASQSVSKLANHFNLGHVGNIEIIEEIGNKIIFTKGAVSQENISVEPVYFKDDDDTLKLAWNLNILTLDGKHWWSARVDAVSGEILDVNDWVLTCNFGDANHSNHNHANNKDDKSFNLFETTTTSSAAVDGSAYNVFALPTESPNHGPRTIVTEPADAIASPFGWHDDDGIVGPEYTDTQGNNVFTKEDIAGNDALGGNKADGGVSLNFDFPLDLTSPPAESLDASLTNLFYINNMVHDITYHYGFDEASGNFQEKHYNNVNEDGSGDPVFADGLDGSGLNNANFGTPPDGSFPRMQMFLWGSFKPILTINNTALAGGYSVALPSEGEGDNGIGNITRPTEKPITGDIVIVDDGTGSTGEEGCNALTNVAAITGKIAIIRRGSCNFTVKIQNAQDAGAIAVIVANHNNPSNDPNYGDYVSMYGVTDPVFTIPSIFINFSDGEAIISAINNNETVNATIVDSPLDLIDGSYDNGVIIHEYAHGISTRLTGGAADSDCLPVCTRRDEDGDCIPKFDTEQMGEGWSDWFGLMLTMKASDVGTTGRGIATFDLDQATDGAGLRPYRYSTDTAINPTTYGDTNDRTAFRAPHGVGSVWAAMLWDLTWAYIDKYGFDADLYNGSGGNNKVMQIVMDGLKLQVCQPGFVDGRDAILAADMGLTGGENQCMIWEVFAARGLGVNADQGNALSRVDQTEDFEMPDASDASLANCTTLSATDFNSNNYKLYPNPARSKLTINAAKSMGDVVIDLVDINGRKVFSKEVILSGEVELNIGALQSGLYILRIKGDAINANEKVIIK